MVFRIAVTGTPGVGKSTLVAKVAAATGMRVGGVLAQDKHYKDRRIGFACCIDRAVVDSRLRRGCSELSKSARATGRALARRRSHRRHGPHRR